MACHEDPLLFQCFDSGFHVNVYACLRKVGAKIEQSTYYRLLYPPVPGPWLARTLRKDGER